MKTKNSRIVIVLLLLLFSLFSCNKKGAPSAITYIEEEIVTEDNESYADVVEVPFKEIGGVRIVPVTINGVNMDMIFDTGASTTCISTTEAMFLLKQGLLTEDDIIGKSSARVADGRITQNTVIRLKEVVLGGKIYFNDVTAMVVNSLEAPLLLGNEDILDRVASFKIDNESQTIHFTLK